MAMEDAVRYVLIKGGVVENIVYGEPEPAVVTMLEGLADSVIVSDGSFPEPHIGDTFVSAGPPPTFAPTPPTALQIAQANIAAGFPVTPEGFTLALTPESVANWTALKGQLRDGLDLGAFLSTDSSPYPIVDTAGTPQVLTVQRLREVLFAGGNYYAAQIAVIAAAGG